MGKVLRFVWASTKTAVAHGWPGLLDAARELQAEWVVVKRVLAQWVDSLE